MSLLFSSATVEMNNNGNSILCLHFIDPEGGAHRNWHASIGLKAGEPREKIIQDLYEFARLVGSYESPEKLKTN